jgi:CheY-like chemotaxis protein
MTAVQPDCPSVLIVEDDALTRRALSVILRKDGYQVLTAAHGQAALAQLRAGPRPCVILLDLAMPVMDGYQFRAEQQRDQGLADIPVIVVTGVAGARGRVAGVQPTDYFDKPVDTDALRDAIRRHCGPGGSTAAGP